MTCLCKEEFFSISSRILWKRFTFFFNLAHIRTWERHMNPCRALRFCYLSEGKRVCLGPGRWRRGGNLFWGFRVIASFFGRGRNSGWGLISVSFLSRAVGRRLIRRLKIGDWGFRGPFRGIRFGFICNGGGERAEEDLIGQLLRSQKVWI